MVFFGSKKTVRDTLVVSRIVRGTCGAPFGCPHRGTCNNNSMVFFGRGRSLHLRKMCARSAHARLFFKLVFGVWREGTL
jgi:hypothetical protein